MMSSIRDKILKIHLPKPKYEVINEIASRWSPRNFSDEKIPVSVINRILEASRWAPSARNRQSWYFYYASKPTKAYQKLFSTLDPYNQSWAKSAPLLILACINSREENPYAQYDLGGAVFSLVVQARSLGYYSRQMALFDKQKVKEIFRLKEQEPFTIIAIGKIGDYKNVSKEILETEFEERPRKTDVARELTLPK